MSLLTKEQLLQARPLPVEVVFVPEWSGDVRVQGLSAGEADAFNASLVRQIHGKAQFDREHYCAKLLSRCLVNEKGERVLTEGEMLALSGQSAIPVYRLTAVAERLSGLQPQAVEDAAKN